MIPEEIKKEAAVTGKDYFTWGRWLRNFDVVGYMMHRMDAMETSLRNEIKAGDAELSDAIQSLHSEMQAGDAGLRSEMQSLRSEMHTITKWSMGIFITLIVGFAAVIIPLIRLTTNL